VIGAGSPAPQPGWSAPPSWARPAVCP